MNRKKFAALAPDRAASFFVGRLSIEDSPCDVNADCRIFCTMTIIDWSSGCRGLSLGGALPFLCFLSGVLNDKSAWITMFFSG